MPEAVVRLLAVFEAFNLNIGGLGLPLQCFGVGKYVQQLAFTMLFPLVLAALLVLGFLLRAYCRSSGVRAHSVVKLAA